MKNYQAPLLLLAFGTSATSLANWDLVYSHIDTIYLTRLNNTGAYNNTGTPIGGYGGVTIRKQRREIYEIMNETIFTEPSWSASYDPLFFEEIDIIVNIPLTPGVTVPPYSRWYVNFNFTIEDGWEWWFSNFEGNAMRGRYWETYTGYVHSFPVYP